MEKKNSYDSRLYAISKNISSNIGSDLSYNQSSPIQNTLSLFYKQLTGQYRLKKGNNEYSMPVIDFKSISDDTLEKLCKFYLDYIRDQEADPSVRKDKSNLSKIDLTATTEFTDLVMYYAEKESGNDISHQKNNVEFYKKQYAYYQQSFRENIDKWTMELSLTLQYLEKEAEHKGECEHSENFLRLREMILKIILFQRIQKAENYKESIEDLEKPFGIWRKHYHSLLYIDIFCWITLQTVTGFITSKSPNDKIKAIQQMCDKLDNIVPAAKSVKCSENIFMTYAEFRLFAIFRTHFLEEISILEELEETHSSLQCPSKEYSLLNDDGTHKDLTSSERITVYLEGETKGKRAFKNNFEYCKNFLTLYNATARRKLPSNDITLKAIYREIILESKTVRNKQRSKTIIRNFVKNKKFKNYAEYYFINEKINWSIYREYGLIEEFRLKNQFQKKLYASVNLLLTYLKPEDIFIETMTYFSSVFSIIVDEICDETIHIPKEAIDDFLSKQFFLPLDPALKPSN